MARNKNTLLVLLIAIATLLHSSAARPAPQPTSATPPTAVLESAPAPSTGAVTYTVGDTIGWTIPTTGASYYVTWASGKTFKVGDILVFNYQNMAHDVEEVTKETYNSCSSITDPLATYDNPPVRVTLNMAGPHYFICGVPGHCSVGQKLAINVTGNTTPPNSAATPPSHPSPAADPPQNSGATSPPQNSGAASLGNLSLFATLMLSVAAAFFY